MTSFLTRRSQRARLASLWTVLGVLIAGQLAGPAQALAVGALSPTVSQSCQTAGTGCNSISTVGASNSVFSPWFKGSVPWNGKWGAFNTNVSERLGGQCALSEEAAKNLDDLTAALQDDQRVLDRNEKKFGKQGSPEAEKNFQKFYNERLTSGKGAPDGPKKLDFDWSSERSGLPPVKAATSFEAWHSALTSSDKTSGCANSGGAFTRLIKDAKPSLSEMLKNPVGFFIRLMLSPFLSFFGGVVYAMTAPYGLGLMLSTPHSERGDTILNSFSIYGKFGKASQGSNNGKAIARLDKFGKPMKGTDSRVDCGKAFSCQNINPNVQEKSGWLKLTRGLRDATSAIYGVIVIVIALVYLWRRDPGAAYDVKTVLPRVLAAVMLSAAAPFIIGGMITFSNWVTAGLISGQGASVPNQITDAIVATGDANMGSVADVIGSAFSAMMPSILAILFSLAFLAMVIIGIAKQIALIALIVATPIACLSFVIPKFKGFFGMWIRGLIAVCAIPVACAVILVTGLELSHLLWSGPDHAGSSLLAQGGRFLSAAALLITMRMMLKAVTNLRGYATGNYTSTSRAFTSMAVKAGGFAGAAFGAVAVPGFGLGAAAALAGGASQMGDRIKHGGGRGGVGGRFMPSTRSSSPLSPASRGSGGAAAGAGSALAARGVGALQAADSKVRGQKAKAAARQLSAAQEAAQEQRDTARASGQQSVQAALASFDAANPRPSLTAVPKPPSQEQLAAQAAGAMGLVMAPGPAGAPVPHKPGPDGKPVPAPEAAADHAAATAKLAASHEAAHRQALAQHQAQIAEHDRTRSQVKEAAVAEAAQNEKLAAKQAAAQAKEAQRAAAAAAKPVTPVQAVKDLGSGARQRRLPGSGSSLAPSKRVRGGPPSPPGAGS